MGVGRTRRVLWSGVIAFATDVILRFERTRRGGAAEESLGVARALELATEAAKGNRDEAGRLRRELAELEAEQGRLVELLMDRGIAEAAKASISRKPTDAEKQRAETLAALDGLHDDANDNTEGIAAIVREVFAAAREILAAAATPLSSTGS